VNTAKTIALAALLLPATAMVALAAAPHPAYKQRHDNFETMGKTMKAISGELKMAAPRQAVLKANANVLMNARITPLDVDRTGISEATGEAARAAMRRGGRLKLVASAARGRDGRVTAAVSPRELPRTHLLATLDGDANALLLHTDLLETIAICQLSGIV
jgi:hypothetical protein